MHKCQITVYDKEKGGVVYSGLAFCVGGDFGIRAYYTLPNSPNIIHEAHGDDGYWWNADSSFHRDWSNEIVQALEAIRDEMVTTFKKE